MKIGLALRELHRAENDLADELITVAERHKAEHEVYYVGRDLARWSQEHVHEIAEAGRRYDLRLSEPDRNGSRLLGEVREKTSELLGRRPEPGMLLLADLRRLHRMAAGVSVDWELLGQGAQAVRDVELLQLAKRCHPQTLRQMRWANATLKALSPQVLTS